MTEELYFNVELRNCLDAAGFSDCGENDQWNWWYQRLHQAHDASVDKVTDVQRVENAKLRELVRDMWALQMALPYGAHIEIRDRMRELGIGVE